MIMVENCLLTSGEPGNRDRGFSSYPLHSVRYPSPWHGTTHIHEWDLSLVEEPSTELQAHSTRASLALCLEVFSTEWPLGRMQPRIAMTLAQHKRINIF